MADLEALLRDRSVATAESCTAGLLAQHFASIEGSGDWFRGGVVAYQRDVKFAVLDVTPGPVVTERAATEMASGVAALLRADVAVAVTGAAGPDPHDGAPPGTVVIATYVDGNTESVEYCFDGSPEVVCLQARDAALRDLERALQVHVRNST